MIKVCYHAYKLLVKIRSLVLIPVSKVGSTVRSYVVSCGSHKSVNSVGLSVVIHVLSWRWRCIPGGGIEVFFSGDIGVTWRSYTVGTGSLGLGFYNFCCVFFVCFCFFKLKYPFLKWV